jgi:hypothetical protein
MIISAAAGYAVKFRLCREAGRQAMRALSGGRDELFISIRR